MARQVLVPVWRIRSSALNDELVSHDKDESSYLKPVKYYLRPNLHLMPSKYIDNMLLCIGQYERVVV